MNKTGYEELALDMLREHSDTIDFYLNKKYCDEKTGGRACEKLRSGASVCRRGRNDTHIFFDSR